MLCIADGAPSAPGCVRSGHSLYSVLQVEHPAHQDVFALDAEIKRLEKSMTQLNDKLHSYSSFKTLIGAEPEVKVCTASPTREQTTNTTSLTH